MWSQYNAETETVEKLRAVTAHDFEYAFRRVCDPRLNALFTELLAALIDECAILSNIPDSEATDDMVFGGQFPVQAIDNITLRIELSKPAGYFLAMTTTSPLRAVYSELIEQFSSDWTGSFVANGPYLLASKSSNMYSLVRNPHLPDDLWHGGNIDQVNLRIGQDSETALNSFREEQGLDSVSLGSNAQDAIDDLREDERVFRHPEPVVYYFVFNDAEPPFDNVHARRAFSAIFNRNEFVEEVLDGRSIPMTHLVPPDTVGSVPVDEVGVGFDPEYAREQMTLAGYENCQGLPEIEIVVYSISAGWGQFWVDSAEEYLDCDRGLIRLQEIEFCVMCLPVEPCAQCAANIKIMGWGSDYPDAHYWFFNAGLHCDVIDDAPITSQMAELNFPLPLCNDIDDLILEAGTVIDPVHRAALYRQIEEMMFGEDGVHRVVPLYMRVQIFLVKDWFTGPFETDGSFDVHWDAYSIDMEAKLAARGEAEQ